MRLDAKKFGLACALAAAILWVICSLFVTIMPVAMMNLSGHMVHGNFNGTQWQMGMHGLFFGLIFWAIMSGITAWLAATFYNKLLGDGHAKN